MWNPCKTFHLQDYTYQQTVLVTMVTSLLLNELIKLNGRSQTIASNLYYIELIEERARGKKKINQYKVDETILLLKIYL